MTAIIRATIATPTGIIPAINANAVPKQYIPTAARNSLATVLMNELLPFF